MSIINKTAVLNPLLPIMDNIVDYIPRATTSKFGMVAIGSGINVDHLGRIYLDTQEYSDRLTAIEAQAASSLATQKSEVAAAIAQVNLTQSQTITALTLEVNNLKTNLTDAITTTQTDLINRADQLAQNVTDITDQLALDKAAFTQEIQDALVYLENAESVASALRTPRKINGTDFDGRSDITTNAWGATRTFKIGNKANSINGTSNVDYSLADIGAFPEVGGTIQGDVEVTGNLSVDGIISATLEGIAASADKLQTPRNINGVSFDGSADITLPLASTSVSGTVQLNNTLTSTDTDHALTAAQGKVLNDTKLAKTENAVSASKLQTSRTISLTGDVTGSVSFDGSADASIATIVTGLGVANGIATLDASGQVPSTQLPSYVDDVLEYLNVAAFPTTGETGKIYVETTGNTTYRWGGTGYVKITSGEVSSVAGKVGVVTLTKSDVGLSNVDNTSDTSKIVASASKLTTARTLSWTGDATGSLSFNGTADVAAALSLANSGVAAGTYKSVTVDAKGRVTDGNNGVTGLVTSTAATGTTNVATTNTSTFLNITEKVGSATPTVGSSSQITGAGTVTVASDATGKITITGSQAITGNAATATKLATPRTINGVSFDGTADITTTNWGTARTLTVGRTGKSVNGSDDVAWTADEILPAGTNGHVLKHNGTSWVSSVDSNTAMSAEEANGGTATTAQVITAAVLKGAIQTHAPVQTSVTGNAATATKLQTPRTINGVSFDGSSNITIADSTKLPLTGGTLSGQLVAPNILINRSSSVASGISWYSSTYNSWQDYMAPGGSTDNGTRGNLTAPTGTYVTSWARRSVIEPSAGYGWTFETMLNSATAPAIVAELSANGTFKTAGDIHGASLTVSGNINATQFSSASPYSFLNRGDAQNIMTGGVLVSNSYADITKVPTNGIYSKGTVHASAVNTNEVRTSNFYSSTAYSFYGPDNSTSQRIKCNSILASNAWADEPYVPYLGIFARGDISSAGNITAWGNVTAYSDQRLKDNINRIESALDKVQSLNGVTFTRNDLAVKDKRYVGLIAQEVQSVIPEAVTVHQDVNQTLSVDYQGLVGLLVEAVKELSDRIEMLEG